MNRGNIDKSTKLPDKVNLNFSKIVEKCCLKAILPFIIGKKQWIKPLSILNKITTISHSQSKIREKKFVCFLCKRLYESTLLLLLHLQLAHADEAQINKYEIDKDHLLIYFTQSPTKDVKQFYYVMKGYFVFSDLLDERISYILNKIIKKICKKPIKKKIYYHSGSSIFQPIGSSSQDQDSQSELSNIQRQLQKMRINDIIDINQTDKHFFIKWNETVHKTLNGSMAIDRRVTLNILDQFLLVSKQEGIKRVHLVMHLWTLWSAGKITTNDMIQVLLNYDKLMQQ